MRFGQYLSLGLAATVARIIFRNDDLYYSTQKDQKAVQDQLARRGAEETQR